MANILSRRPCFIIFYLTNKHSHACGARKPVLADIFYESVSFHETPEFIIMFARARSSSSF
jgi:hypothetical protein